jgi:hypothetical protein
MPSAETVVPTKRLIPPQLRELAEDCEKLARTGAGDTTHIAALLQKMILTYYGDVRKQAQQSFVSALVAAIIGVAIFIFAIWKAMTPIGNVPKTEATLGVIAGGLVQVISAINFYLYGRAARQFGAFHICLERTNRYLLANSLCEKLDLPARDAARCSLIDAMVHAPMLTLDVITGPPDGRLSKTIAKGENVVKTGGIGEAA